MEPELLHYAHIEEFYFWLWLNCEGNTSQDELIYLKWYWYQTINTIRKAL